MPRLLDVGQVAARLGVCERTVRNLIYRGELLAIPVGSGDRRTHWRVSPAWLESFVERNAERYPDAIPELETPEDGLERTIRRR